MPQKLTSKDPNKLHQTALMAEMVANGMTHKSVAAKTGVHQTTVTRRLKTDVARQILDEAYDQQVQLLPKCSTRFVQILDSDDDKIALSAIQTVWKNTGITPTHTASQYITNIYQQHNTVSLSVDVLAALDQVMEGDTIDIEPIVQCSDDSDTKGS